MFGLLFIIIVGIAIIFYEPKLNKKSTVSSKKLAEKIDKLWDIAQDSIKNNKYLRAEKALLTILSAGTALEIALTTSTDNESKDVEAGVWKVFVRNTSGCLRENTVTVTVDSQPSVASITVDDACSDNTDYPIRVKFNSIGIGQHQYKIDGIVNWQNITVATETVLPIRLADRKAR